MRDRIDFVIAGVQKAGTTALHTYLRQNTAIYMPEKKELHFFKRPFEEADQAAIEQLHRHFAGELGRRVCGEASPLYLFWPPSLPGLRAYNPNIKLVICLRRPELRAYSAWCMERRRARETMSFSDAIRTGRSRVRDGNARQCLIFSYVERGFYSAQIERAFDFFPPSQLFFLRSDDIHPEAEPLRAVQRFLGVAPQPLTAITDHLEPGIGAEPAPADLNADLAYLHQLYLPDLKRLGRLTGLDIEDWIKAPAQVPN